MAWLQNLAGRAEDLLIKIDKNAANVLTDTQYKLTDATEVLDVAEPTNKALDPESHSNVKYLKSYANALMARAPNNDNCTSVDNTENIFSEKFTEQSAQVNKEDGMLVNTSSPKHFNSESRVIEAKNDCFQQNSFGSLNDNVIKYEEQIAWLEKENEEIKQQLVNIRHLFSELVNENSNLQMQIERAHEMVQITQNEMEQYRARAQRILQEKEKLLSNQSNLSGEIVKQQEQVELSYNEELKKELAFHKEKCKELSDKLQRASAELSAAHQNFMITQKEYERSKQVMQEMISNERKIRSSVEEECRTKTKELQSALHQISDQNKVNANKSQLVIQLQEQLKKRTTVNVNEDLELRLENLTQTLMSKQNVLETLTTERNALRLLLEKLENERHKIQLQQERSQTKTVIIEHEKEKSDVPNFLKISPFDAGVTRRVKHAYSSLDKVSVRVGVFLRRYPAARVFVICYMVLLHFWVFIILCTYVPTAL